MAAGILRNLRIKWVSLVPRGANFDKATGDGAHILLAKSDSMAAVHVDRPVGDEDPHEGDIYKSTLTTEARNSRPDSSFAAVYTDASGKKQRKFPYRDEHGAIDRSHLANALSRIAQHPDIPAHIKSAAKAKLEAAARSIGMGQRTPTSTRSKQMAGLMKRLQTALALAKAMDECDPNDPDNDGDGPMHKAHLAPEHHSMLKALHEHLGKMIAAHGPGPHPPEHPVHQLIAHHEALGKVLAAHADSMQAHGGHLDSGEGGLDEPGAVGKLLKAMGIITKEEPVAKVDVSKAVEEAVAKALAPISKELADAKAELKKEQDARILKGYEDQLTMLAATGIDVAKVAPALMKLDAADKDTFTTLMGVLKGADSALAQSTLFKEFGSKSSGRGDAWAQIVAKANELRKVEKSAEGKPLTEAQAIDRILASDDPDVKRLVKEYRDGRAS